MPSAAFPLVVLGIMDVAEALPSVRVVRGRDISLDPGDVVMVGIRDLDESSGHYSGAWDQSGSFRQSMQTFGGAREELGQVNCVALSRNGNLDREAACTAVFDLVAGLTTALRAAPNLGVASLDYLVAELESGDVSESPSGVDAAAALSFVIAYKARI